LSELGCGARRVVDKTTDNCKNSVARWKNGEPELVDVFSAAAELTSGNSGRSGYFTMIPLKPLCPPSK
jgi:hypothetical protein